MKTPKLRRLVGAVAVSALILSACSSGDDEPADDTTSEATEGSEAATDAATEADATEAAPADGYDWSDVRRRQAVSMAINRQEIVDVIFQGSRAVGDDFWPGTFAGYRGGDFCPNLQFNPEAAAALWEEAGGNAGPVTFWFNSGGGHEEWVEAVANQIQANLGVEEVAFESLPFAEYLDKLDAAEVDGPYRLGWLMDYPSPGNFLGPIHGTRGSSNTTGFSNEEFDAAVAEGDALPLEEAVDAYQRAGDILCEEVPIAPMFYGLLQVVYSENVDNVSFDAFQALNVTEITDEDGDGAVSMYICEPQNSLFGQMTGETCGSEVVNGLSSGLFSLDKETGELVYDSVASSIESEDDQSWTITLNDGWTFHDGTPVTAQSFVDSWNWLAYAPNAASNSYFASIPGFVGHDEVSACGTREATQEDVDAEAATEVGEELEDCAGSPPSTNEMSGLTAVDDTTIQVELEAPFAQLPLVLLYNAFDPQPESFFEASDEGLEALAAWGEAPVGNGPFRFPEGGAWEHNVEIALEAYPDFGGEGPQVDNLTYQIYAEPETGYNDLRSGALDVMDTVPTAEITNAQTEFGDRYIEEATSSFNYLGFPIDLELVAEWQG
jgi:oligopeptide transport system substrate-binding protein